VVKTRFGGFLPEITEYVVANTTSVTEGYGQGGVTSKKLTALKAPVLLGWREA
jgi:hypothetical protein